MSKFPNKAGDHADTNDILRAELKAAGIQTMQEHDGHPPEFMAAILRESSGEVKTSIIGCLHGWTFKRAWYYWMCDGPGIELQAAEKLHATHGTVVRVDGHCGCPSPRDAYKGLAVGHYHVDTPEGLKALAETIKGIVSAATECRSCGGSGETTTLSGGGPDAYDVPIDCPDCGGTGGVKS